MILLRFQNQNIQTNFLPNLIFSLFFSNNFFLRKCISNQIYVGKIFKRFMEKNYILFISKMLPFFSEKKVLNVTYKVQ